MMTSMYLFVVFGFLGAMAFEAGFWMACFVMFVSGMIGLFVGAEVPE